MNIKFPLVMRRLETLILVDEDFFEGFSRVAILNWKEGVLSCRVLRDSDSAGLFWMLDANGVFFKLSVKEKERNIFRRMGVIGKWTSYKIEDGCRLRVGELEALIKNLHDENQDFPNVANLRGMLSRDEPDRLWGAEDMQAYLGG